MSNRIKNNLKNLVGQTLNQYYSKVKPTISDLRYKQEYQNRIIECMVGEVDDNYITTPETDNPIVKLEHSKEGLVKVPTVKGKTILVDADGNETDTPAEGCRLVSVGESEDDKLIILSKNKNIFNKTDIIYKNYFSGGGKVGNTIDLQNSNRHCCVLIKVQPNTSYTFSSTNLLCYLREMQTEKVENGSIYGYSKNHSFTTKSKTNYLAINIRLEDESATITNNDVNNSNIMVRKSETSNEYVEPKHHKTEILLNEPLRNLPNGVCDEIVGNKIVRRVGRVILNTDKKWVERDRYSQENVVAFEITDENILLPKTNGNDAPIGDIIQGKPYNVIYYSPIEGVGIKHYNNRTIARVNIDYLRLITQDVDGFKQWLSENPITVLYELAEPIIEELPNGMTLQGFDDTTMYIENSIIPTVSYGYNALVPYKEELSQQKEEVETNTLDIENNIIPYLMDMEFNLMTMEDK